MYSSMNLTGDDNKEGYGNVVNVLKKVSGM